MQFTMFGIVQLLHLLQNVCLIFYIAILIFFSAILFVGTSGNDDIGKKLSSLIKQAKHLSDQAHKKLTNQETSMDTLNKYRTLLVEELDNLELLLKRSESLFHYLRNPFIRKLLIYNKNDLELYVNYFEIIIQLYEQGNDQSIPVLTQLIMQIIDYTDADVGWLNANGFREQANKISDHSGRLQSMLKQLKQNMFQMENDNFSNQIRQILSAIVTFENLVLSVEKECNINFIYH